MSPTQTARFAPGQVVRHRRFGYRGLIFDVDATFKQSPEWYDVIPEENPLKDRPWYHILVDGEAHTTYVSENSLAKCKATEEFDHPLLTSLFSLKESGRIESRLTLN
ncbi:MAG: heat shock protein HspQ [Kordiimonadaceae bacterium]|nr:heat shock protein HspQ [Kordiimonadaceae bacterium]